MVFHIFLFIRVIVVLKFGDLKSRENGTLTKRTIH